MLNIQLPMRTTMTGNERRVAGDWRRATSDEYMQNKPNLVRRRRVQNERKLLFYNEL